MQPTDASAAEGPSAAKRATGCGCPYAPSNAAGMTNTPSFRLYASFPRPTTTAKNAGSALLHHYESVFYRFRIR